MSVRATIEGFYGGVAPLSLAHLLDRYRDEARADALREAAEKIRGATGPDDSDQRFTIYNNGWYDARTECADLIDPDKEN